MPSQLGGRDARYVSREVSRHWPFGCGGEPGVGRSLPSAADPRSGWPKVGVTDSLVPAKRPWRDGGADGQSRRGPHGLVVYVRLGASVVVAIGGVLLRGLLIAAGQLMRIFSSSTDTIG